MESEFSYLNFITVFQIASRSYRSIQIRSIETARVANRESIPRSSYLGMATRDGNVIQEDLILRGASQSGLIFIHEESSAFSWTAENYQHRTL